MLLLAVRAPADAYGPPPPRSRRASLALHRCLPATALPAHTLPFCSPEIVQWVKKKTGPATTDVPTLEALETAKADSPVFVLGYFEKFEGDAYDAYALGEQALEASEQALEAAAAREGRAACCAVAGRSPAAAALLAGAAVAVSSLPARCCSRPLPLLQPPRPRMTPPS